MAKWSEIWTMFSGSNTIPNRKKVTRQMIEAARFTPPAKPLRKPGGQYPHLQPFFKNRREERKAA